MTFLNKFVEYIQILNKNSNSSYFQESDTEEPKPQQDLSRPVSSEAVSGTPWCVVWTGDGRVFFYNPTTK